MRFTSGLDYNLVLTKRFDLFDQFVVAMARRRITN